mgnify:CR=1
MLLDINEISISLVISMSNNYLIDRLMILIREGVVCSISSETGWDNSVSM